ncbi:thiamine-phosphate kinase [Alcanivorax hongdengensis A-11-3]|uniref:Thiamine-monophosphate kinase n=1 Tax=Alcanivorax hongdengensis A-11-3 TaxID=1177179 RepID=L0WFX4_9GAMM|nr:thiamine-phosphate kinase [Alcanivorax hongdengensis]EKF75896.1 thiamine-phosphate kinase [Alcanivorax hongdengensis A-11-3]
MLDEFSLIRRYFHHAQSDSVVLGPGDDAALLTPPAGQQLVMTQDTSLAGRHFPEDMPAADIGYRCLAVNLSDLAAMGAEPLWFLLSLTLPDVDEPWLEAFSAGLFALADASGISLVGGDVTRGPLSVSIQATGAVPPGQALRRDGARAGDRILVGGVPGEAGEGLNQWQAGRRDGPAVARLCRPAPQLVLGRALRGQAHAAIDISDGLLADLVHVLKASGDLGACLHEPALMTLLAKSPALSALAPAMRLSRALQAGDDYLLLFTQAARAPVPAGSHVIGEIQSHPGLRMRGDDGTEHPLTASGWQHF